jgi:LytS/YehU family sensor histidine kinase
MTRAESGDDDPPIPQTGRNAATVSILGFWLFYFALNTFRMAVTDHGDQGELILRRAAVVVAGIGLTYLLYLVLRRYDGHSTRFMVAVSFAASIPIAIAYAAVNYAAFYAIAPVPSILAETAQEAATKKVTPPLIIAETAMEWYFFIVCWAILYLALTYAEKVRLAERSAARFRAEAQAAQLRALRYQVNPHFLFNTLNSLSALVLRQRGEEADRMIVNLSTFFRTSLASDATGDIPLGEEIRMQRLYLDIEQVRFPDRLAVKIAIPPELEPVPVPSLILQPLVENAIKYGVARSSKPVEVSIAAREQDGRLVVTVEDSGETPLPDKIVPGVGLANVAARLEAQFGEQGSCRYGARPGGGFRVEIALPSRRHG